ncbi:oxidoreductase [Streptomyces sp. NPDC058001]|uniref:oxidoreductase n=1 Tax=Streptomyces sp. NPDC058001 TaxID=3346300 RepID=UPI0036E9090E
MLSYENLSAAERRVWDAFPEGRRVDLRTGTPEDDDPAGGHAWPADRTVRAAVLAALLLGDGQRHQGAVPALRLTGARITGPIDLSGAEVPHALWLADCHLDEDISLYGATVRSIGVAGSRATRIDARMARIEGRLDLRWSAFTGTLDLANAHIAAELVLDGAEIAVSDTWAVNAGGLVMGGGIWCRKGFTARGGISMPGATMPGGLFLREAHLDNPRGIALCAENATASTMDFRDGFTAHGTVDLSGAQITGPLRFGGAVLHGDTQLPHGGTALNATRTQAGALEFTPALPPSGAVDLRGAHVDVLHDRPDSWPRIVHLQGLVYGTLQSADEGPPRARRARHEVDRRLAWLRREPAYVPQPYEQLASWYRTVGHDDDARRVLLAKQRHRRATMGAGGRVWSHVLDATVGFGYRPWLAGLWLLALTLLGTAVFSGGSPHAAQPGDGPPFNPLVYALDLLIPIGGLGQRDAWYWTGGLTQGVSYALIGMGWILTTAVVAGVTRTLNKT